MGRLVKFYVRRHPVPAYIIISYTLSWVCWITALVVSNTMGFALPVQDAYTTYFQSDFANLSHIFISVIFILGGFGPLIAAVTVVRLESGSSGTAKLKKRMFRFRVGMHWYRNALILAMVIPGLPFLVMLLLAPGTISGENLAVLAPFIVLILCWEIFISYGEEPGWRGFLLPRLQRRLAGERYIWVLGLIWAVWHYPYVVYHSLVSAGGDSAEGMLMQVVFALAGYTMSLIGQSYVYVWFYNNTKSVFLAAVFHGLLNAASLVVLSAMEGFNPLMSLAMAVMPWVVVAALTAVLGKEHFPGHPKTQTN